MSVAERFKSLQIVPQCITEVDLSSVDESELNWHEGWISGLTLSEALALYWNLESLSLNFQVTGDFDGPSPNFIHVTTTFNEDLVQSSPAAPKDRVCWTDWINGNYFEGTESNGTEFDFTDAPGAGSTYCENAVGQFFPSNFLNPDNPIISDSGDGTYAFWFDLSLITGGDPNRPQILLGARGTFDLPGDFQNLLETVDLTIGAAGTMRLKVWAISTSGYGAPGGYTTGYSRTALTVTPNYYTYP